MDEVTIGFSNEIRDFYPSIKKAIEEAAEMIPGFNIHIIGPYDTYSLRPNTKNVTETIEQSFRALYVNSAKVDVDRVFDMIEANGVIHEPDSKKHIILVTGQQLVGKDGSSYYAYNNCFDGIITLANCHGELDVEETLKMLLLQVLARIGAAITCNEPRLCLTKPIGHKNKDDIVDMTRGLIKAKKEQAIDSPLYRVVLNQLFCPKCQLHIRSYCDFDYPSTVESNIHPNS